MSMLALVFTPIHNDIVYKMMSLVALKSLSKNCVKIFSEILKYVQAFIIFTQQWIHSVPTMYTLK